MGEREVAYRKVCNVRGLAMFQPIITLACFVPRRPHGEDGGIVLPVIQHRLCKPLWLLILFLIIKVHFLLLHRAPQLAAARGNSAQFNRHLQQPSKR